MITLEQIKEEQKKVNELVRKYEEQEQQKEKETYELEYPEKDEHEYFSAANDGNFYLEKYYTSYDDGVFETGNYFITEKEAELEVKRRKLMTRFNQFRDKCNGDWKPDFTNSYYKHYITYLGGCLKPTWTSGRDYFTKFGYFKSAEDCEKAIELFGDEIKELF